MNHSDKMVNNFTVNPQEFTVGDEVKLSSIALEWDEVRFEYLKEDKKYKISSEYKSNHLKPQQWVSIEGTKYDFYYPSWCFVKMSKNE
jgi:hypothetical protein